MRLSKASISLKENYGQAMAVTAPLGSVVSSTTAAIFYSGYSVVFATILALIGSGLWIYTLTRYTSKLASAGGFYTFGYSAWKSKTISFFEAVIEALGYSFLNAVNVIAIYNIVSVALRMYGVSLSPLYEAVIIAVGILYPSLISLTHIRFVLGKIVTISATAEVFLLVLLFAYSLLAKGFHSEYFVPSSNLPMGNLAAAFVLTVLSIDGAGAAAYLGEETRKPLENTTKGIWLAFILGGVSMVFGTYAIVALWNGSLNDLINSPQPLISEMISLGLALTLITLLLSINSLLASNVGTTLGSARILFNLARENSAPSIFAKVNKAKEPIIATVVITSITTLVTISAILLVGIQNAFDDVSLITGILWLAGRVIDAAGVPLLYYRIGELELPIIIIPLATTAINLWGVTYSLTIPDKYIIAATSVMVILSIIWYVFKGRKGKPGSLVVDENNEIITIDEYLERIKSRKKSS